MASVPISVYPVLLLASAALISYTIVGIIYRLHFSPISRFPGPKIAAATFWYEFYYDVILQGQYIFHLRDLHSKYGPIIRVNPYELHIADSSFYEKLYVSSASGEKRDKWEWVTKQSMAPGASFATADHFHHRSRRAALNPFFSKASVRRLQPVIDERVQRLVNRLRDFKDKEQVVKMNVAFTAFTTDVVQEYAYGRSEHCIEEEDFRPFYHDAFVTAGRIGGLLKQMKVEEQVYRVKAEPPETYKHLSHPTIFHEILHSSLPPAEKTNSRLRDEAWIVIGAGTLTTAWTLTVALYHILASPRILARLKADLKAAIPDREAPSLPLHVIEKIPYLFAIIQESLRLSYGVTARLPRIAPNTLHFVDKGSGKDWAIPPHTPVSMSSVFVHHDESIFPDSHAFIPERWIQPEDPRLDRYLVAFTKGSRQCLGIELAYAEMYLALAAIFLRFGSGAVREETDEGVLELWETGSRDVELAADAIIPLVEKGSKGVRIMVRS